MLAPIIMFAYNRLDTLKKTVNALEKNILADKSNIIIFSDYAKNIEDQKKVNQVREYLDELQNNHGFNSIDIRYSQENFGLARSIINGVSNVIERFGKVIVLEDDLITSTDFIEYMNEALKFYEDDKRIWSISGYTFNIKIPKSYNHDVFFTRRLCSWGWATWKDRWNLIDWEVSDFESFNGNKRYKKSFNMGGRDLSNMLKAQMEGEIDSWAIRSCYSQFKHNMYTVYPVKSKVKNIGFSGSGTHGKKINERKYNIILPKIPTKVVFSQFELNKKITKSFCNFFISRWRYFLISIKGRLVNLLKEIWK